MLRVPPSKRLLDQGPFAVASHWALNGCAGGTRGTMPRVRRLALTRAPVVRPRLYRRACAGVEIARLRLLWSRTTRRTCCAIATDR